MSFHASRRESGRAFERVRRSLLPADDLPFCHVLTAVRLADVFESEGVDFSDNDPDVVYTPAVTLWAFLSQMLFTGEQRSCSAAVARVAAVEALSGRAVSDINTGAYCRARCRISEAVPRRLALDIAGDCEEQLPDEWRWRGHRTFLVDGSTFGHRPNRVEPRAIKRRPTPHDWLTKPRATARAELLTGCSP